MVKLIVRMVKTEIPRVRVSNHIFISENTKQYKTKLLTSSQMRSKPDNELF
jgi:hypothetical protein